ASAAAAAAAAAASAGDRSPHQPKISRKIRACQECQSRKIKCGIEPGQQTCTRCQRLGLQCVVNKSLQTLLEDESEWKSSVEQQMGQVQVAPHIEPHIKLQSPQTSPSNNSDSRRMTQQALAMAMTRENSQEPHGTEPEADNAPLVAAPMTSLFEVTKLRNLRSNLNGHTHGPDQATLQEDFISQGKVSVEEAEWLFRTFSGKLAAYLWGGIPLVHQTLTATRASSPLLTASILAVSALHVPGKEDVFDVCYAEFLHIVSSSMFDRYHSLDDVRGLCIGAFWLSDVSWKLSGHAVRIATELNLHQSFSKALRGDEDQVEKARLWYLLYVCDHHFSIAYGRPPVIDQDTSISCHELFLQLPGITNADTRLHSQVGVFLILSKIFMAFGPDSTKELSHQDFRAIAQFNADLNTWKVTWEPRLAPNKYVGFYPAKGVHLHYHFGRLQLNSLALRGITPSPAMILSSERRECANIAISSAIACLKLVLEEPSIRDAVVGVPLYLHTNIVFAAVFLLKMQARWKAARFDMDGELVTSIIERVTALLKDGKASERHLTYHVSRGLSSMLAKFKER
ncbi:hypothetical protein NA57DRAFT_9996, partial [Rhizodiscina lignyota]